MEDQHEKGSIQSEKKKINTFLTNQIEEVDSDKEDNLEESEASLENKQQQVAKRLDVHLVEDEGAEANPVALT